LPGKYTALSSVPSSRRRRRRRKKRRRRRKRTKSEGKRVVISLSRPV
jgi:type VI protein secretion system component VasA